ncbi:MAG: T9SS type A sorting domain-containing protein [bacterium]
MKFFILILLIIPTVCFSYPKEAYTWIMAPNYGIQFFQNKDISTFLLDVNKFNGKSLREHFSVISDTTGKLLYFSKGDKVYDSNFDTIKTTKTLTNNITGYTQITTILKAPGDKFNYFLLNTNGNGLETWGYSPGNAFGIRELFSDQPVNSWYKDTIQTYSSPDFGIIQHNNKTDYWLLTHENNFIYSRKITKDGLVKNVVKKLEVPKRPEYITISPKGDKVLLSWSSNNDPHFILYNFDNITGKLTKPQNGTLGAFGTGQTGVSFSYDGRYIYFYQNKTLYLINTDDTYDFHQIELQNYVDDNVFDMSMGPDGRMYIAYFTQGIYRINSTSEKLINNEISLGYVCEYTFSNDYFSNHHRFPKFMHNCFDFHLELAATNPCNISEGTALSAYNSNIPAGSSWHWTCPDSAKSNNLILTESDVKKHGLGKYYFETDNGHIKLKDSIDLSKFQEFTISISSDKKYLCTDENLSLKAISNKQIKSLLWSTGSNQQEIIISQPGKYTVEITDSSNCTKIAEIEILNASGILEIKNENSYITEYPYEKVQNIQLEMKNLLSDSIQIQSIDFVKNNFMEVIDFPSVLDAKTSKNINLKISPKDYGKLTDTLLIKFENDCNTIEQTVFKADLFLKTKIVGYSVNTETNKDLLIPFYALSIGTYDGVKSEHFSCLLRIDTTFFSFNTCTKTVESNSIKNGTRELLISGNIDGINSNTPLFTISGKTLEKVGNSTIEILKFDWDNSYIQTDSLKNPVLSINQTSVTDENYSKYIKFNNGTLEIASIDLKQNNVKIYNVLGDICYENIFLNNLNIDVSQYLNGIYLVVLEFDGIVTTRYKFLKQ